MLALLTPIETNLFLLFFGAMLLGSLLELGGGFLLKKCFHISWWDYSEEPFNIGGYVCLKYSLAWGVIGIFLLHILHPPIADLVHLVPPVLLTVLLVLFYAGFILDITITVLTVLQLNRDLQEITRLSELIRRSSDKLTVGLGTSALRAAERVRELELSEKAKAQTERVKHTAGDTRVKLQAKLEDFERLNTLLDRRTLIRSRLFKAFPRMKNLRSGGALREMKSRVKDRVRKRRGK